MKAVDVTSSLEILLTESPQILAVWTTRQLWFDGLINGMVFGLLALGIVLIYRSTRVINLAVGNMGLPAVGLMALMVINYGFPYWAALPLALLVGTLVGSIIELAIIRRLFNAPRVIVLVATIGIAQLMQAILAAYPDIESKRGVRFPVPLSGKWNDVFGLRITGPKLTILIIVPLLTLALSWFLNKTIFGQTVQASANNADLAKLSGIKPKVVSLFVWTVAGTLSSVSLLLLSGSRGSLTGITNLGPNTMTRALAAAVIAGMSSFPRALIAGITIGIAQAHVQFVFLDQVGLIDFILFLVVAIAVAFQSRSSNAEESSFSFSPRRKPIPERLNQFWWVRNLSSITLSVLLLFALIIPFIVDLPSRHLLYASVLAFAICAVSLTVVTGWAGQLSLSQMAFAGIGALAAAGFNRGLDFGVGFGDKWHLFSVSFPKFPFLISMLLASLVAGISAAIIGLGALRVKGLLLAVSTFAFALAASQYIYRRPVLSGGYNQSVPFRRGSLGPIELASQRSYYFLCLGALVLTLFLINKLRKSGIGRSIIAVRENENTAAAYTVVPHRTKLIAFSLAGCLAGLGGSLLGGLVQNIPFTERFFMIGNSLKVVSMVVIGGLGTLMGPVIGAMWVIGLPAIWPENDLVPLFTSSIGLLVLLLYFPGGLVQIAYSARDSLLNWAEQKLVFAPVKTTTTPPASLKKNVDLYQASETVLETKNISVSYGGLIAVNDVDIKVNSGEVVGLIGTNGAGKSTLMNAIGGYVPSTGTVTLLDNDVTHSTSAMRARKGLGRTFQAARLFPELTVRETVQVALEARNRARLFPTALSLPSATRNEINKTKQANELIDFLGLGRYADSFIAELSTGTRRIVELAGLLALDAKMLCLDEPTAGIAQRETEAFGPLLKQIQQELGASMLVIEHDMPMIMALSDRVYCLEAGTIISEGQPFEVRNDPAVIASYLGTDERAISRSDTQ